MAAKKRIIWLSAAATIIIAAVFIGRDIKNYLDFRKVAEAGARAPWQFGGDVVYYQPVCVATPPDGICKNCIMCTAAVGNYVCASYSEVQFSPATGSESPNYVCPFQGFYYSRWGGPSPSYGQQIMGYGASAAFPWAIAVPSSGASRIQKLVDIFNFFIAGKKE
jgi:hypothetical protein